jgi:hypothetical protein
MPPVYKAKKAVEPALERFPCHQCGGILKYLPGTQNQTCEYCGFENHIEIRAGIIHEYDLEEALHKLSLSRPTKAAVQHIHCDECGATFQFESSIHAGECPFCGTPIVSTTTQNKPIQPKSLLPFNINQVSAKTQFKHWLNKLWFAPNTLKKFARGDTKLTGVYIPFWTFDSDTITQYHGERADDYYVNRAVQVMRGKRRVTENRRVANIRSTPVSGLVRRFFYDVFIGASRSLPHKIVDALQPWDLEQLIPYDENYLSGFRSEFYQIELDEGFDAAKQVMDSEIYHDVAYDIGGNHQRIHSRQTRHNDNSYKHCLLPIWSAAFRYQGKSYRFVINGRTGKVQGERPYSKWKIGFAVLAALVLVGGILYFMDKSGAFNQQPGSNYQQPYIEYDIDYGRY